VQPGLTRCRRPAFATGVAANLLELDDRGVLAADKLADFVVLDAGHSQAIGNSDTIATVWPRSRLVRAIDVDARSSRPAQ
jgi:cytosine/adenosine deaminase-related metal-dependent hydrolase